MMPAAAAMIGHIQLAMYVVKKTPGSDSRPVMPKAAT
jgi:hypothetical protein